MAEDRRIFLPIAISCDGAFLTRSQTLCKVPISAQVEALLPRYNRADLLLHPDNPISVAPQVNKDWVMDIRSSGVPVRGHGLCLVSRRDDERVRRALSIGGPTFIHSLDPCPKGWDYDPMLPHELGELVVETGIWPLYEVADGVVQYYTKIKSIVGGRRRKQAREYLLKQGRFGHFTEEDLKYFQAKVDEMREKWETPAVIPFRKIDTAKAALDVQ